MENDPIRVFDTLHHLYVDFETKNNASIVIHKDNNEPNMKTCFITHRDAFYFFGGSKSPNRISKFDCHKSEIYENNLKFNFTDGTCISNNEIVLLCFPTENKRLCYKSSYPSPSSKKWWQWFSYVKFSFTTHEAISISSG